MARSFNGTSDHIDADSAASYSEQNAFSVALWVKGTGDATLRRIYAEASSSSANPFLLLNSAGSAGNKKMVIVARDNGGGTSDINSINTTADVLDGNWHHFAYTQDASGHWQAYVDGVADVSGSFATAATTVNRLTIGCLRSSAGTLNFWNGAIAEVANWARQLSAGEVALLAAGSPAAELGPTHYWPLWGTDSPEPDIGNG